MFGKEIAVMRMEKKYAIDEITAAKLNNTLALCLKKDRFNNEKGYLVRSLYFDSFYDKDYWDKQNGIENRRKIRLRTYDPSSNILKLELKEKRGENQLKRSLTISKDMAYKLINGQYGCLLELDNDFATELFYIMQTELYRPKVIVEYNRNAFIVPENNIRITIDSNVKANEGNFDIFSKDLSLYTVLPQIILEVKYNNFLVSYIKDIIDVTNKMEISLSKYCSSRRLSYI